MVPIIHSFLPPICCHLPSPAADQRPRGSHRLAPRRPACSSLLCATLRPQRVAMDWEVSPRRVRQTLVQSTRLTAMQRLCTLCTCPCPTSPLLPPPTREADAHRPARSASAPPRLRPRRLTLLPTPACRSVSYVWKWRVRRSRVQRRRVGEVGKEEEEELKEPR